MRQTVRERWLLLGLITLAQIVCLFLGSIGLATWIESAMATMARERILMQNQQLARQTSNLLAALKIESLEDPSGDWRRAQDIIRNLKSTDGGFVCIIDATTGQVLCHPDIESDASLFNGPLGQMDLLTTGGTGRLIDQVDEDTTSAAGEAQLPDGIHLIGATRIPGLNAIVLAHQREEEVLRSIRTLSNQVRLVFWSIAIVITLLTTMTTWLTVQRYDNKLTQINAGLEELVDQRSTQVMRSRDALIFGLAALAESRDGETGEHLERITKYTRELGEELAQRGKIGEACVRTLEIASALHDIGKVAVPDAVLLKPGKLTDTERREIEKHPLIGGDTILALKRRWGEDELLKTAAEIIFAHHERWDGTGYPFGHTGEGIPLSARIVAVADVYDALRSVRPYKDAMPHDQVAKIIRDGAGTHFDPAVVEAFNARAEAFAHIADTEAKA